MCKFNDSKILVAVEGNKVLSAFWGSEKEVKLENYLENRDFEFSPLYNGGEVESITLREWKNSLGIVEKSNYTSEELVRYLS